MRVFADSFDTMAHRHADAEEVFVGGPLDGQVHGVYGKLRGGMTGIPVRGEGDPLCHWYQRTAAKDKLGRTILEFLITAESPPSD